MKVIVKENLGADYVGSIISSCNQNGIQAIADYTGNEILFYDPKNWLYCRHSDMIKDASLDGDIFDLFNGKNPEFKKQVMKPTKGPDFEKFAVEWNALQRQEDPDIIKTKNCSMIRVKGDNVNESSDWLDMGLADWYMTRFPDDAEFAERMDSSSTFQELWEALEVGDDVYSVIGVGDSTVRERLFQRLASLKKMSYGEIYRMWQKSGKRPMRESSFRPLDILKTSRYHDSAIDDIDDDDHGDVDLRPRHQDRRCWGCGKKFNTGVKSWGVDKYNKDYCPACAQELGDEIVKKFNENMDNPRDWSANEDEVEVHWLIDDPEIGIAIDSTETFVIDLDMVSDFQDLIDEVKHQMEINYGSGLDFEYDEEWVFVDEDNLLERFGYSMNESGSNGGTIDVTLKFTNGHYGKKLKAGDERTIKLDTSTAPTIYDQDDMLTWIAEVASDQVPGGGCFTKWDFETIDPPDDVLIKAVMGDEGFGPDVDVDFEDFEPEDVPSEISYKDALKFYKKMHDAYDDRKLDYTKYDKIRKRLMDAIVKGLLKEKSLDELADEWFINYGTMNGWGWKTSFKYNVACALHEIHKKEHPDEHAVDREDTMRGWHSEKCSCGLASSCDSSD